MYVTRNRFSEGLTLISDTAHVHGWKSMSFSYVIGLEKLGLHWCFFFFYLGVFFIAELWMKCKRTKLPENLVKFMRILFSSDISGFSSFCQTEKTCFWTCQEKKLKIGGHQVVSEHNEIAVNEKIKTETLSFMSKTPATNVRQHLQLVVDLPRLANVDWTADCNFFFYF